MAACSPRAADLYCLKSLHNVTALNQVITKWKGESFQLKLLFPVIEDINAHVDHEEIS